jgi:phenylpyruvate tautomerase PptA (4-oxalocrotonate tautomerase family)
MPLVRIETRRGLTAEQKRLALDAVHDALVTAFRIPENDRHQRVIEYEPEDFEIPPGKSERYMIVEIDAFAGRSLDAKRLLYKEIVAGLGAGGLAPDDVLIVLRDVPPESWGVRGGQAATDIDLGFEIEV